MDFDKYEIKELIHQKDEQFDEIIQHLQSIIMDRSIPEKNKVDVRKQLEEIIRMKSITMKPPVIVVEPKE